MGKMNQIIAYLESKEFKFRRRGDELIMDCPFCDDRLGKFSINSITGLYNCLHLNTCGAKGDFYHFQKELGDKPKKLEGKKVFIGNEKKKYIKPKEIKPIGDNEINVYRYLKGRGFNDETIKYFRLGADGSIVKFPFRKNGVLVNIKHRDIHDKNKMWQEKNAEQVLFNRDNIENNILVIVEGEFDAMALYQYGIEAVSVPAGVSNQVWVENEWDYLDTFKHILICFDTDQAGKEGAVKLAERLGLWRCSLVTLPLKDANECLLKNISTEEITLCFARAKELSPETLVSPDFFNDKIQRLFEMGAKLFGTPTAWTELDSILKGWRGSEVTIWSGRNGSGKSTILNQVILDLAAKGVRSCIYSGEMPPERYLRWAIIQHTENNYPQPVSILDSLQWMTGKLYILNVTNTITPDELLNNFEYAARRYGVKHFVIDSLMKISINDSDEYNEQKRFVSRLTDFVKIHDCHVHLVAHPRKAASDTDEPGKVDIKGTSHITDLAHNVIVLYRPTEDQKSNSIKKGKVAADMVLFVKKNREFGIEGAVMFKYAEATKKFISGV
jgi:twinkle protein